MRILLTGAAGFIGSHLAAQLLGEGHAVVGLDNFDDFYEPARKRRNAEALSGFPGFRLVEGDIRTREAVEPALEGVDAVIHLAARAGVRPSFPLPGLYSEVNVAGTGTLLDLASAQGVPRFVFISSSSVYGEGPKTPFTEKAVLGTPMSPYAATKIAGELLCRAFSHRIPCIAILRLFSVFGPRQRPDLALHKFARLLDAGKPIPVFGPVDSFRDYTYVEDIVEGIVAALEVDPPWSVLNLGSGRPVTLDEMIRQLEAAMGREAERQLLPAHKGDLFGTWADIRAAEDLLGYRPKWRFEDGVRRFVEWFLEDERNRAPAQIEGAA